MKRCHGQLAAVQEGSSNKYNIWGGGEILQLIISFVLLHKLLLNIVESVQWSVCERTTMAPNSYFIFVSDRTRFFNVHLVFAKSQKCRDEPSYYRPRKACRADWLLQELCPECCTSRTSAGVRARSFAEKILLFCGPMRPPTHKLLHDGRSFNVPGIGYPSRSSPKNSQSWSRMTQ